MPTFTVFRVLNELRLAVLATRLGRQADWKLRTPALCGTGSSTRAFCLQTARSISPTSRIFCYFNPAKMFRNNYDNDSVTFSPQGRIFQVEYALEAIKQGSAAVGLVSKKHAVLVALKRNAEDLGSYQKKIIGISSCYSVEVF
jgi:hypothetical protein